MLKHTLERLHVPCTKLAHDWLEALDSLPCMLCCLGAAVWSTDNVHNTLLFSLLLLPLQTHGSRGQALIRCVQ